MRERAGIRFRPKVYNMHQRVLLSRRFAVLALFYFNFL